MRKGLRQVFPHLAQDGSDLIQVETAFVDYSESLPDEKRERLPSLDTRIGDALSAPNGLDEARRLFVERGALLRNGVQSIYKGTNRLLRPPDPNNDEVIRRWTPQAAAATVGLLPSVVGGHGWEFMKELQEQGNGPRVVSAIPEFSIFISVEDAKLLYESESMAHDNIIFLPYLSHPGIALQPQVISGMREAIDRTA